MFVWLPTSTTGFISLKISKSKGCLIWVLDNGIKLCFVLGTGGSLSANVLNVEVILPGGLNNKAHSRTASEDFNSDFDGLQGE